MRTEDAVRYFQGVGRLAERLGISRKSIWKWGDRPPAGRQYELEVITGGALTADQCTESSDFARKTMSGVADPAMPERKTE